MTESRNNYPALFDTVKGAVMTMAGLETVEKKTNKKDLHSRLGVEDVSTESATSKQITLLNQGGKPLASLIIGKNRQSEQGTGPAGFYARRANEDQAWLVKGALDISADPTDWIDKTLFNIASDRISEITIQYAGQKALHLRRQDHKAMDYTLDNLPAGFKVKSQVTLNSLATALEDLAFDDVMPQTSSSPSRDPTMTTLRTFDGLIATVATTKQDDRIHAQFEFSYDSDYAKQHTPPTEESTGESTATNEAGGKKPTGTPTEIKDAKPNQPVDQEVATLNEKTKGWIFVLPTFKAALLQKKQDELIASLQESKPRVPPLPKDPRVVERAEDNKPKEKRND